jgi:hypothetical protein
VPWKWNLKPRPGKRVISISGAARFREFGTVIATDPDAGSVTAVFDKVVRFGAPSPNSAFCPIEVC